MRHAPFSFPSLALLFFILFSVSCKEEGASFKQLDEGIAFRRVTLGDGEVRVSVGDGVGVAFRLTLADSSKKALAKDSAYFLLDDPKGEWTRILSTMVKGDSSVFLLDKDRLKSLDRPSIMEELPDSLQELRLELSLLDRRSPSALLEWKAEHAPATLEKERWKEWKRIDAFVKDMAANPDEHFVQGIYFFPKRKGKGPRVRNGRTVELHYRGYLPDSTVLDDSYKRGEPLRFRYGNPKQVIPGLEIGLGYMREGGKAELVIPSYLAFGKEGGSTGILPPHTFVYYEVEVVEVTPS